MPIEGDVLPGAWTGAVVGLEGQPLRMEQLVRFQGPDREEPAWEEKDRFFAPADGSGRTRLGHRPSCVRRA